MAKNSILIDGSKLRNIVERRLGFNIYKFCEANGYSKNLVAQAIRTGKASPLVQNLLRLYEIAPEEYEYKEPITETPEREQISIEDITPLTRSELKDLIKEALKEVLSYFKSDWICTDYDEISNTYRVAIKLRRESNARDRK